jgi:hypothetical protein
MTQKMGAKLTRKKHAENDPITAIERNAGTPESQTESTMKRKKRKRGEVR